jgi:hypothetical protein
MFGLFTYSIKGSFHIQTVKFYQGLASLVLYSLMYKEMNHNEIST